MCGINGILLKASKQELNKRIQAMNTSLTHRGPNDEGIWISADSNTVLGHRRLSIIDLDPRSKQPMVSTSGRWVISYNGEIYNYKEMKENLHYDFKTESDTEVILAYVEKHGLSDFLSKCNGMFSIALYDTFTKKIYLCRDRLGIKPLFYTRVNGGIVFSSEIKGILSSGLVSPSLNIQAVDEYLGNRYIREPYTFFQDIYQVRSGNLISFDLDGILTEYSYWNFPEEWNTQNVYDEKKILFEFGKLFEDSISKRMIADVPVGTYLSGGLDSSLLTAIVASKSLHRINTYSIGFNEINEFEFSRTVARKYDTIHHEIHMSKKEYFDELSNMIYYKDAPLGVPNEIPLASMSNFLKNNITVVLSGEGADELMGGYGKIFRSPFDYFNQERPESFYTYFINKYEYVPREFRDQFLTTDHYRNKYDALLQDFFSLHSNEYNVFYFFHNYHIKGLLQRVDTCTMHASVEARVPFLDHRLLEFSYSEIPLELKLKWKSPKNKILAREKKAEEYSEIYDIPKYLLKKYAEKYLPADVIYRKKIGFPTPLDKWYTKIKELFLQYETTPWLKSVDRSRICQECKQMKNGGQILWMFLNLDIFYYQYKQKKWKW